MHKPLRIRLQPALFSLTLLSLSAPQPQARETHVPEALAPWMAWVAHKHPELACPSEPGGPAICVAYGSLNLDLGGAGGAFVQTVTVFGEQWVRLPGSPESWPFDVRAGGAPLPVVPRNGSPQARLKAGEYAVSGRFSWPQSPSILPTPPDVALLSLRLNGLAVSRPERDGAGRLQLGTRASADTAGESPLTMRVYRKLQDGIPMLLETHVTLSVSGREREILTGRLLPEGSAVLSIRSDLPMRIEPDGRLRAQIRSGEHALMVTSRFLEPVSALAAFRADSAWPEEEIWSFEARRDLRVAELSGASLIDPSQTGMPGDWKNLPAYRLVPGDTLRIEEKQRGNPAAKAGTLSLNRTLWLDFSGDGYTFRDFLSGSLEYRSRLEMRDGFEPGRAEVDHVPMMITVLDGKAGVEIPAGPLNMVSLGRLDDRAGSLAATGWNQDFQGVRTMLHLPPGWKLLHAEGPDQVGNSWIAAWSLWDVFLACILTLAVLRLAGWLPAGVALACFALLSQETGLPGPLWLNLLAALGLWSVLPEGKLRAWVGKYRIASLLLLAILWLPFAIAHVRMAIYPQLDGPGASPYGHANRSLLAEKAGYGGITDLEAPGLAAQSEAEAGAADADESAQYAPRRALKAKPSDGYARQRFLSNADRVQSGPGEPEWGWETASLGWSGPVQAGETLELYLLRPWVTRALRALQALLPGLLLLLLAFPGARSPRTFRPGRGIAAAMSLRAVILFALAAVVPARAAFPPDSLLGELEARMLAAPACAPECAALSSGTLSVSGDRLRMDLVFDVADTSWARLPDAGEGQFSLESLRAGNRPAASATRLSGGRLAVALPRGRHVLSLEGRILGSRLELDFAGEARNLSVRAPGYSVQGDREGDGRNALILVRDGPSPDRKGPALTPDPVPAFVDVHREFVLDQEWSLVTRVIRISPVTGSFSVEIPLLEFEHPVTPGISGRGAALISFRDGQAEASWRSAIDQAPLLRLSAGPLDKRAESWSLAASSRWHVETTGFPPIRTPHGAGAARWRPLPGDTLAIRISEPRAASGPVKTVEKAVLTVTPGRRESAVRLELRIRAGQGDMTRVGLPAGARLESLSIDSQDQSPAQREGAIDVPLRPGLQDIVLSWKHPEGIGMRAETPRLTLDGEAANISMVIHPPADRWILWAGGNAVGPALLLWGVLAVMTGLALLLGRTRITPLGFRDWALLFAGTSTVNVYAAAPLLALLLALRHRERRAVHWAAPKHNLIQIGLAGLGVAAFGLLLAAVPAGLLGAPDMLITGNDSDSRSLRWFLDRTGGEGFPAAWIFSLPLWVYRLAMLAWSLWLAFRLLQWLRWSWERFASGGYWKPVPRPAAKEPPKPVAPGPGKN